MSRLSDLNDCPLHRKTPFGMTNVSMTQLSIARHYGGIRYNGDQYTYFPDTDELVRDDVLRWQKEREREKRESKSAAGLQLTMLCIMALCGIKTAHGVFEIIVGAVTR